MNKRDREERTVFRHIKPGVRFICPGVKRWVCLSSPAAKNPRRTQCESVCQVWTAPVWGSPAGGLSGRPVRGLVLSGRPTVAEVQCQWW